jgi:hypothetical protein
MTIKYKYLVMVFLAACLCGHASGSVIIGTMTAPSNNGVASISSSTGTAQGFTMTGNYTNLSTMFELSNGSGGTLAASGLGIGLYQDSGGFPTGSALVTFTLGGLIPVGDGTYTAPADNSSFQLNASTSYWLILNYPTTGGLNWVTENSAAPSGGGAMNVGSRNTGVMSSSTQVAPNGFSSTTLAPDFSTRFEIDGTTGSAGAVPEPGSVLLVTLGFCGLSLLTRRRTRFSRR